MQSVDRESREAVSGVAKEILVETREARWQKRYSSRGGKEVLIKSTLSSIPTYLLSLLQSPGKVTEMFGRLQRNFLWDMAEGTSHLVNKRVVTSRKVWG